ncbi:MAG TPA: ABC transporter ATP-binding protein [Candidatus Binatia bacterium]|nr:ABC transporter ATP-binding protein [Candidatus Binatia bacterium]
MAANDIALELSNIYSGYGEIEVLKDISISVRRNTIVSILGANGAGKSTLLKTIFGIVRPTSGQILLGGDDVTYLPPIETLRRGVTYVPEGRSNFPGLTVHENLEMGAYIRNDRHGVSADIKRLYERFPILGEKRHEMAGNLSGGQQQALEMGIALMLRPQLLLIDEPTLGLAPILVTEVFKAIQDINTGGATVVLVEQNARRALEISDYAFVLELGRIRFHGPAQELYANEEIIEAYLGER